MKKTILLCLVLTVYNIHGQLSGTITDDQNTPLEYATVAVYNQETNALVSGMVTDGKGAFLFKNIPQGIYFLESSFLGYRTQKTADINLNNSTSKIDLGIIPLRLGNNLNEVTVLGEAATMISKIDRQVYAANAFKSAEGGTAMDIIRQLPAISINGQGTIRIRGSAGFVVLLNGKPLQGDATALIEQLPANAIESIEVITAPSAKYDPEGKGGVLNILTTRGKLEGAFGQVNLKGGLPSIETYGNEISHQRYGADATYNITNEAWNVSFGANYQRNDKGGRREGDVYTIIDNTLTRFPSTGERSFDETNYNGRFNIEFFPNKFNALSVGVFAGKRSKKRLADIVYYDNHSISPVGSASRTSSFSYFNHNLRERKSDFALGSIDYSHTFSNASKLSLSFLYEYTLLGGPTENQNVGYPDNTILYQDEYNTNDNPLYGTRAKLDYSFSPFKNIKMELGYQYRNLDHSGDFIYQRRTDYNDVFSLVPEFSSEVNLQREIHAFYTQLSGSKGGLQYSAGVRVESMDRNLLLKDKANTINEVFAYDFTKLYPSAAISYTVDDKTTLKLAYSKRVARTTTFKMNPFPEREHSETLEQGDPNLKPEFIDLVELGIEKKIKPGNRVFATAYFRNTKNAVNRVNTVYNDTILNRIYSNIGTAKTVGIELGAALKPSNKWNSFVGANLYRYSIDGEFDNRLVDTNATQYTVNVNTSYSFWENALVQLSFNYMSDRITAQGEDSRYYSPNLTLQKTFLNNRLKATMQWLNIDMGMLNTNEQRISTWREDSFYTTTNYIYEVDMIVLNLSYTFKNGKNKSKFIDSEFGKREF